MALSFRAPAAVAVAIAAAVILAPAAAADDDDLDDAVSSSARGQDRTSSQQDKPDNGPSVPKGWSNEALWAGDQPGAPDIFGTLPKPPVYALD